MTLDQLVVRYSARLHPFTNFSRLHAYRCASRSVLSFSNGVSPSIDKFYTPLFLSRYADHLFCCGLQRNSISNYMSVLRSLYNFALKAKLLPPVPDLFDEVNFGSTPTAKRAVSPAVIARIMSADLSAIPRLEACRDYFMLTLYFQGMPFVDLAYLKKNDIKGDHFVYDRRKTGGSVTVGLHGIACQLLNKYMDQTAPDSPYALPLLTRTDASVRAEYETVLHRQNRQLKELADYIGLEENLTTYTARHSWATIAHHNDVNIAMVSQGMGHHSERVTRVYLDSFGYERLTQVNLTVLGAIQKAQEEIERAEKAEKAEILKRERRAARSKQTEEAEKEGGNAQKQTANRKRKAKHPVSKDGRKRRLNTSSHVDWKGRGRGTFLNRIKNVRLLGRDGH